MESFSNDDPLVIKWHFPSTAEGYNFVGVVSVSKTICCSDPACNFGGLGGFLPGGVGSLEFRDNSSTWLLDVSDNEYVEVKDFFTLAYKGSSIADSIWLHSVLFKQSKVEVAVG